MNSRYVLILTAASKVTLTINSRSYRMGKVKAGTVLASGDEQYVAKMRQCYINAGCEVRVDHRIN
jgi:hypothetical protein